MTVLVPVVVWHVGRSQKTIPSNESQAKAILPLGRGTVQPDSSLHHGQTDALALIVGSWIKVGC